MNEYLKSQTKTNEVVLSEGLHPDELDRFSKADFRWAEARMKQDFPRKQVKKGEIYQFEFGKNFIPEVSYEHRGLVIGVRRKILYVLPICSYDPQKQTDVYHPTDFPACFLSIEIPQNWKENSLFSEREFPIFGKWHIKRLFFPYYGFF